MSLPGGGNNGTLTIVAGRILAVALCLVAWMAVFGIFSGLYMATMVATCAGLLWPGALPWRQWSLIDKAFTAFMAVGIASVAWSPIPLASVGTVCGGMMVWASYILMRRLSADSVAASLIVNGYTLLAMVASVIAIGTFAVCASKAHEVGFDDMYPLRYLYRPLGNANNCWGETALMLAVVACLGTSRLRVVAVYAAMVAALLTFSRGVYLSAGVLVVVLLLSGRLLRCNRGIVASIVAAIVTVAALFPSETITTVAMMRTQSQRASVEWRHDVSATALERFTDRPLTGYGAGTFSLITDNPDKVEPYTDTPPSLPAQTLVETGLVGCIAFTAVCVAVTVYIIRNRRRNSVIVAGAGLMALIVKELSQSILLVSPTVGLIAATLLAYMQRSDNEPPSLSSIKPCRWPGVVVLVWTVASVAILSGRDAQSALSRGIGLASEGDYKDAANTLDSVRGHPPYDRRFDLLLAETYLAAGRYDDASRICASLPASGFGLSQRARVAYHDGQREEAALVWAEAILQLPRLVGTNEFRMLQSTDSVFVTDVIARIDTIATPATPVQRARYGYVLYHTGRSHEAMPYLREAVAEAPTLRTPWLLLGDTTRYNFLAAGALCDYEVNSDNNDRYGILDLLLRDYSPRLQGWYSMEGAIKTGE